MIRHSTLIAGAALMMSLVLHFLGVFVTLPRYTQDVSTERNIESVSLGTTFEELAETPLEPVEPERPEPPETQPQERPSEMPTSDAQVASPNPQATPIPDQGVISAVRPSAPSGPVTPEQSDNTPAPDTDQASGGTETALSDARLTPPVTPSDSTAPAAGDPLGGASERTPTEQTPAPSVTVAPAPDILAALPAVTTSAQDLPESIKPSEELIEAEPSDENVTVSLRPQERPDSLKTEPRGSTEVTEEGTSPTELIESPLTAYRRDGTNLFTGRRGGVQQGGGGLGGALGPGNSNITNYAGEVLMHLNRVPAVQVSTRGWARVVFRINPDGTLAYVDIIDGTGSPEIEGAAKSHVRNGVPFPLPPGGEPRLLNFIYSIR